MTYDEAFAALKARMPPDLVRADEHVETRAYRIVKWVKQNASPEEFAAIGFKR